MSKKRSCVSGFIAKRFKKSYWQSLCSNDCLKFLKLPWSSVLIDCIFNIIDDLDRIYSWVVILYNVTIWVNQELCKVPWKLLSQLLLAIPKFRIASQVSINFMWIFTVDCYLLKKREVSTYLCSNNLAYLFVCVGFLAQEIVAWKS